MQKFPGDAPGGRRAGSASPGRSRLVEICVFARLGLGLNLGVDVAKPNEGARLPRLETSPQVDTWWRVSVQLILAVICTEICAKAVNQSQHKRVTSLRVAFQLKSISAKNGKWCDLATGPPSAGPTACIAPAQAALLSGESSKWSGRLWPTTCSSLRPRPGPVCCR